MGNAITGYVVKFGSFEISHPTTAEIIVVLLFISALVLYIDYKISELKMKRK